MGGMPTAALSVLVTARGIGTVNKQLAGVQGQLTATGAKAGGMGAMMKKGLMVGAAAVVSIVGGLFKLGKSFDEAYDTIRVGTGATGKTLEGLKGDFKEVVKAVPTDFKSASTAIADLNTRLGLTGKPLQDRAKQFLELSRITKTDVSANIKDVTRAFGDWEVKTGDQAGQLDKFFRASQSSGASVGELAQQVVQFGAPLRQVGFSLDEATAMFASFEKAGVNTQTMMPGLKQALGNFAKEGIDPKQGLAKAFKDIQSGAMSSEAAVKLFGKRAGTDMIEAVKQGRFNLDDLTKAMRNGGDTIMKAGADTQSFGEKWTLFKNKVLVALEPIAMRVFNGMGVLMDKLPGIAAKVIAAISTIAAPLVSVGKGVVDVLGTVLTPFIALGKEIAGNKTVMLALATAAGVLLTAFVGFQIVAGIQALIRGMAGAMWALNAAMRANPIGLVVAVIAALVAAFVVAYRESETFRAIVDGAFKAIKSVVVAVVGFVKGFIVGAWGVIKSVTSTVWNAIGGVLKGVWNAIKKVAQTAWAGVKAAIINPIRSVAGWVWDKMKWVAGKLKSVWEGLKTIASAAWGGVKKAIIDPIRNAAGWVWDKITWLGRMLKLGFGRIWDTAKNFASGLKDRIVGGFKTGINFVIDQLNRLIKAFNKLPGPNLGLIGKMAQGGQIAQFAQGGITAGGVVRAPMLMMGEDAPRHPEWVIPTNPAYRARALGLLGAAARDIGASGFAHGGRTAPGGGRATHIDQSREVHLHEHGDRNYFYEADEDRATRKQLWQLRVAGLA